jgi:integrase/recombinase XerD
MLRRTSAPIAELNDRLTQQYNRVATPSYCRDADYFVRHLSEQGITLETVPPPHVSAYLRPAVRRLRKYHGLPAPRWESGYQCSVAAFAEALASRA